MDTQQAPENWLQLDRDGTVRPLSPDWEAQMAQWPELAFKRVLLQNAAADDFLIELSDGRVSEIHVSYHGDAGITFSSVMTFESYADWLTYLESL